MGTRYETADDELEKLGGDYEEDHHDHATEEPTRDPEEPTRDPEEHHERATMSPQEVEHVNRAQEHIQKVINSGAQHIADLINAGAKHLANTAEENPPKEDDNVSAHPEVQAAKAAAEQSQRHLEEMERMVQHAELAVTHKESDYRNVLKKHGLAKEEEVKKEAEEEKEKKEEDKVEDKAEDLADKEEKEVEKEEEKEGEQKEGEEKEGEQKEGEEKEGEQKEGEQGEESSCVDVSNCEPGPRFSDLELLTCCDVSSHHSPTCLAIDFRSRPKKRSSFVSSRLPCSLRNGLGGLLFLTCG